MSISQKKLEILKIDATNSDIYISLSFSLFRLQQKWHDLNAINFWEKKIFYLFVYR